LEGARPTGGHRGKENKSPRGRGKCYSEGKGVDGEVARAKGADEKRQNRQKT